MPHNAVHIAVGAVFLIGSTSAARARSVNLAIAAFYGLLALLGFLNVLVPDVIDGDISDDYLHLISGSLAAFFGTGRRAHLTAAA